MDNIPNPLDMLLRPKKKKVISSVNQNNSSYSDLQNASPQLASILSAGQSNPQVPPQASEGYSTPPQPTQDPTTQAPSEAPAEAPLPPNAISGLIQKYFPESQWENASKIVMAESGGNPGAVGDNYPIDTGNGPETIPSYGLFQIRGLPGRPTPSQLFDPEKNVQYAAQLYKSSGWGPWSTSKTAGLK